MPGRGPRLVEQRARRAHLAQRGDHRQHRLDRVLGGHAQDRAQLRGEDLRALEREADAAHAEERVGLGRHGQRRQRLVGAGVERAHDERPAVERHGDLAQGLDLLVLVGQLRAVEEEELGAQQADALGAQLDRGGRLGGRAEVGEDLHARAVARRARLVGALARGRAAGGEALAALLGVAEHAPRRGRPGASRPRRRAAARVPSSMASSASPSPTAAGRPSARARIAACAVAEPWAVAIPRTSSGSRPAASAGVSSPARTMPGSVGPGRLLARDGGDDAAPDVEHVGGALAQQRLVEPAVERGHLLGGVVPRALGGGAARDGLVGGLEQRLVVEQGEVGVEDRRLGVAGARRRPPRGRARSPRARPRSPRPGARARARGCRRRGRAAGRRGRRGGARGRWRRRPRPGRPRARRPARAARRPRPRPRAPAPRAPARRGRPARCRRRSPRRPARAAPSSASAACGPDALTSSVSPKRAPSATTLVRLVARTGAPRRLDGGRGGLGDGHRGRRRAVGAIPSPKPPSASARSASSASEACGPDAVTSQRVAEARAERDDVRQARRAHRRAAALLGHADLGVVVAHGADEARRRARVQADRVADLEARLGVGGSGASGAGRPRPARGGVGLDPELRRLHGQRAARLGGHLLQRRAAARGHRRGHRALHERRLAHQHASAAARASRSRTRCS